MNDALRTAAQAFLNAAKLLSSEAEEYDFPDGMGRGAGQDFWDEFELKLELLDDALAQPQAEPTRLTDRDMVQALVESSCIGTVRMTVDSGPYEVTEASIHARCLIRTVEAEVLRRNPPADAIRARGADHV